MGAGLADLAARTAPQCRLCLDWSERRHHLSGRLGRALLARMLALGWARRTEGSRALLFTPHGDMAFDTLFPHPQAPETLDAPEDCP